MATEPMLDRSKEERKLISISDIIKDELGVKELKTPNGKEIKVFKNDRGYFEIAFASGGEKPKEFSGIFTDIRATANAIRMYFQRKETPAKVEKVNAKNESDKAKD